MTVDILILGAGWTSTFLVSLCKAEGVTYATTNRSGEGGVIKFNFPDAADFSKLPDARTVLVTFPLQKGWAKRLTDGYARKANWIALGTTSIWNNDGWNDRHSEHGNTDRSLAEDELDGTVLCLSGLYGGTRDPKNWITRVAPSKEALKAKASLHLIHGQDVARSILAVHRKPSPGRWLVTDGRVYDWWDLASAWSPQHAVWVRELMTEGGYRALPRDGSQLGRLLDSREFWIEFGLEPINGRIEGR